MKLIFVLQPGGEPIAVYNYDGSLDSFLMPRPRTVVEVAGQTYICVDVKMWFNPPGKRPHQTVEMLLEPIGPSKYGQAVEVEKADA